MGHENKEMNWDNLKTIAKFDGRVSDFETYDVNSQTPQINIIPSECPTFINNQSPPSYFRDTIANLQTEPRPTASTSLLIESLIQLLCLILEDDPKRAHESYNSICEQLSKINLIDNSYSMSEFEEMRSQYQMQIYKIICAVRGQDVPISLPNLGSGTANNKSQTVETCWSRYHREFEEIGFIAGGGFGKVFKARHKLDCIEYAVKQIKIHSTTIKLCHLAEVKTIASLNHPNIVQYKAAWLEPYLPRNNQKKLRNDQNNDQKNHCNSPNHLQIDDVGDDLAISSYDTNYEKDNDEHTDDDDDDDEDEEERQQHLTESKIGTEQDSLRIPNRNTHETESSDFIQFEGSNENNTNNSNKNIDDCDAGSNYQNFELNENSKAICKLHRETKSPANLSSPTEEGTKILAEHCHLHQQQRKPKLAILYIQMSLCQLTLRKWLNKRNSFKTFEEYYLQFFNNKSNQDVIIHFDIVNDIFCQILSGLDYIHSRSIVHHDIKPSNIFLGIENDGKLVVQLGDFGLACPLQSGHHGIALGTPLYAAPEQLNGQCNPKSDIFSLGIILLELLLKFNTDMERIRTIENARKGIFPTELSKQSLKLLRSLLSHHKTRPTTKELLEAIRELKLEQNLRALRVSQVDIKLKDSKINELKQELKTSHSRNIQSESEISNLLEEITIKDRKIQELTELLRRKDDEIVKLKKLLNSRIKN